MVPIESPLALSYIFLYIYMISVALNTVSLTSGHRGGATVLKVGGQILRAKRAEKFFDPPPLFGQWGDKILLR